MGMNVYCGRWCDQNEEMEGHLEHKRGGGRGLRVLGDPWVVEAL